jgi:Zn-dependent protease
VFVGLLVHELGHALAYRAYGKGAAIVLWALGGLTYGSARLSAARQVVVSLAGPLTGALLLGLPAWLLRESGDVTDPTMLDVLDIVVWVNVGWAIFNLLPVLPLDGGNIVMNLITALTGRDGERPARIVSIGTAVLGGVWAIANSLTFLALFAAFFVYMNYTALRRTGSASFIRVQNAPRRRDVKARDRERDASGHGDAQRLAAPDDLAAGWAALSDGDPAAALDAADRVLATEPYPDVARRAGELRAWSFLQLGRAADARQAIDALPTGRKANRYLRAAVDATSGAGTGPLVEAFLFGDGGPDRQRAAVVAADWGLIEPLTGELLREGEAGVGPARDLAVQLHEVRPDASAQVTRLLAG